MKTRLFTAILILFMGFFAFSQTIQFISVRTGDPLSKVIVFNSEGDILATSDIEGKIQKELLMPLQESYSLIYEGYRIGNLTKAEVSSEIIRLNDQITEIEPVVIKKKDNTKYLYVRGNFNIYLLMDKKLDVYGDGIATYVFDNKSKNLKSIRIEQYRSFLREEANPNPKDVGTFVFYTMMKMPNLKYAGIAETVKTSYRNRYKEVDTKDRTKMEYKGSAFQNKPFSIFGYRFFDITYLEALSYAKDSKNIRDFQDFNSVSNTKLKHKSETEYHQMDVYTNFIVSEISFGDTDNMPKTKLEPKVSSYTFDFWKTKGFPNMQPVFADFFKETLKEQPNTAKK